MVPEAFLGVSVLGIYCSVAALWRIRRPAVLGLWHMALGWPTGEMAPLVLVFQIATTPVWILAGALNERLGRYGLGLDLVSWALLLLVHRQALTAESSGEAALVDALGPGYLDGGIGAGTTPPGPRAPKVVKRPFHLRRSNVTVTRNVPYLCYGPRTTLDIYVPKDRPVSRLPVVLYVHGGAWVIGRKDDQGLPLMYYLASRGYVGVSINYRLAPKHRFPTFLWDVKAALAWVRENIAEYGGDPAAIVLGGGSAGGHLAILAALTQNDPTLQPGFESADTSVAACIPFYAPADLFDRAGVRGRQSWRLAVRLAGRFVFPHRLTPATLDEWRQASPVDRIGEDAPPFLIIQGSHDVLVWREESALFARELRAVSRQPVVLWEVPGAQHAFDVFASPRCFAALAVVERFLAWLSLTGRLGPAHGPHPSPAPDAPDDADRDPRSASSR